MQVADFGLKGQLVMNDKGEQVEGYQVHLGGSMGANSVFGRKVRGLKIIAADLPDYIERVLRNFEKQKNDGETFAEWARRADEADLR